jgi:hypothetical protein
MTRGVLSAFGESECVVPSKGTVATDRGSLVKRALDNVPGPELQAEMR